MNRIITLFISILIGALCFVPVANASTATTRSVIAKAKSYNGTNYVLGGTSYRGIDCSALTMNAYRAAGINLPRTSTSQYKVGTHVQASQLIPGDLVFFSFNDRHTISHVGMYLGKGKFINATSHKGVKISSFSAYWWNGYVGAKRVLR